jgi:hypothetical protein
VSAVCEHERSEQTLYFLDSGRDLVVGVIDVIRHVAQLCAFDNSVRASADTTLSLHGGSDEREGALTYSISFHFASGVGITSSKSRTIFFFIFLRRG